MNQVNRKIFAFFVMALFFQIYSTVNVVGHKAQGLKLIIDHAKSIVQSNGDNIPRIIAIAGYSGVGKSYFSNKLASMLEQEGIRVAILRCDDFINPDYYNTDYIHLHPHLEYRKVHSVMQKILDGEKIIRKPKWNPKEMRPPTKAQEDLLLEGVDLVLFEGVFTLCDNIPYDFRHYASFGIFLDAHDDDILEWRWKRGGREIREKTQEEFIVNYKPRVKKYRKYLRSSRNCATYLLFKDRNHRYRLHRG